MCVIDARHTRSRTVSKWMKIVFTAVRIACNADRCNRQKNSASLSVRPSVTFRCFVQTNEHTIVRVSASGRTIILVSGEVTFIPIFAGDHPNQGVKVRHTPVAGVKLTNNQR